MMTVQVVGALKDRWSRSTLQRQGVGHTGCRLIQVHLLAASADHYITRALQVSTAPKLGAETQHLGQLYAMMQLGSSEIT